MTHSPAPPAAMRDDSRMSRWRGATAGLLAAVVLGSVTGCSGTVDQAHSVQTRLGRVDGVLTADVVTPSDARAARIEVTFDPTLEPADLAVLVGDVARAARAEDYPLYRLDLVPGDGEHDVLVVDDRFHGSPDEETVLTNWKAVTEAVLGPVTYSFQAGNETIAVDSGSAVLHDVTEVGRIGYGYSDTTWRFTAGDDTLLVSGRLTATDVDLLQRVQRTVGSAQLPVAATSWRLESRPRHLLLNLHVGLPGAPVDSRQVTIARYGEDVRLLVRAALEAVRVTDLPVWLQLWHPVPDSEDVFGWWVSGQRPVPGRDRLDRGWDRWLSDLARKNKA
ncbi:MAG: hypothetical protein JWO76_3110 [Nocardioides sp.]|nr:hypothetical protein [Nocardioides sp.]